MRASVIILILDDTTIYEPASPFDYQYINKQPIIVAKVILPPVTQFLRIFSSSIIRVFFTFFLILSEDRIFLSKVWVGNMKLLTISI